MGDAKTSIQSNFQNITNEYLENTHQYNNYNEIANMNEYIKNSQVGEQMRMQAMNENLKSRVLKVKQEYMILDYQKNATKLRSNIMMFSSVMIALIFIVASVFMLGFIGRPLMFVIVGILTAVFLFVTIIFVKANSRRRTSSWNQYYWSEIKSNS
jgi:transcriptional antiterminator Rof (Rho-off)